MDILTGSVAFPIFILAFLGVWRDKTVYKNWFIKTRIDNMCFSDGSGMYNNGLC